MNRTVFYLNRTVTKIKIESSRGAAKLHPEKRTVTTLFSKLNLISDSDKSLAVGGKDPAKVVLHYLQMTIRIILNHNQ